MEAKDAPRKITPADIERAHQIDLWLHQAMMSWPLPPGAPAKVRRKYKSTKDDIISAAANLKPRAAFPNFEKYRRALCDAAGVPHTARGWGKDSVRRALKTEAPRQR